MDMLITLGRAIAPFAIRCAVTISLAALAALLAAWILGRRQPARSFAFIVAAFLLGALLLPERGLPTREIQAFDPAAPVRLHTPAPPLETDAMAETVVPGLVAKGGSMFQILFSGPFQKQEDETELQTGPEARDWMGVLGLVWLLGFCALMLHHLLGILAARSILSASEPCRDRRLLHIAGFARDVTGTGPVEIRLSAANRGAFLAGIRHPRIVLPEAATRWSEARLAATLSHEHMHARRLDILVAEFLRLLASLAWLSPLPWLAFSLALRLREEACDAAVLRTGAAPAEYAADLLATARALSQALRASATAAISGGSHLERRIRAILGDPVIQSRPGSLLRNASAVLVLTAMAGTRPLTAPFYAFVESAASERRVPGAIVWPAACDPLDWRGASSAGGTFRVSEEGEYARITLRFAGRTSTHRLPVGALPCALPLTCRARMILPFGELLDARSQRPFLNPGWTIWDDRGVPVKAAAAGRVLTVRIDAHDGLTVEIDHGAGVRTRYGMGRRGSTPVQIGDYVSAGMELGSFGDVSPCDIPSLNFGILVQTGGRLVALDPAPFLFAPEAQRATPLGASVLNASVRLGDRMEVQRLLARGIPVNQVSADGTLPLEWVILTRNLAIGQELLAAGADPQAPTWDTHQAHIARHGPSIAEIARQTADPELIALLAPDRVRSAAVEARDRGYRFPAS